VRFVDTNILLYAISTDPAEQGKAATATALLDHRDLVVSAQVLQEFYVQATRPTRPDRISRRDAADLVVTFGRFPVVPIDDRVVGAAIDLHHRLTISYWDAAIIEAARSAGCGVILSEDLSDTVDYAGVRVENPFA
jgi:predicted nucleic acid-binding protein